MRLLQRRRRPAALPAAHPYLDRAVAQSRRLGHGYVGTEHLLLALLTDSEGRAATALRRLGVTADDVGADVDALIGSPAPGAGRIDPGALASLGIDYDEVRRRVEETFGEGALERTHGACTPVAPRLKRALELASEHASAETVRDDDVLLALLAVPDSVAAHILAERGLTADAVRAALGDHP